MLETNPKILIVDDEEKILLSLKTILSENGYDVYTANDGKKALDLLQNGCNVDLVVTDLIMPGMTGIELIQHISKTHPEIIITVLTGHGTVPSAVEAMKFGAYDYFTKPFDPEELLVVLEKLGKVKRMQDKLKLLDRQKESDLKLAEQIHQRMLPSSICTDRIEIEVKYLPMMGMGGDYAHVHPETENIFYITLGDVTGHGIAAAMMVMRINNKLQELVNRSESPGKILHELNEFVLENFNNAPLYTTFFCSKVDLTEESISYSAAAHPDVILWKGDEKEFIHLKSENTLLGVMKELSARGWEKKARISKGDKLIFYTDGIIESRNEQGDTFGQNRLLAVLKDNIHHGPKQLSEIILAEIKNFGHSETRDDMLLLVTEIK